MTIEPRLSRSFQVNTVHWEWKDLNSIGSKHFDSCYFYNVPHFSFINLLTLLTLTYPTITFVLTHLARTPIGRVLFTLIPNLQYMHNACYMAIQEKRLLQTLDYKDFSAAEIIRNTDHRLSFGSNFRPLEQTIYHQPLSNPTHRHPWPKQLPCSPP